jgi:thiamine-phosphate pyrophosphorylase
VVDIRLYAIIDPERTAGRALSDLARRMGEGGATLVQLRDKLGTARSQVAAARELKAALAETNVPLIVNDRVDVAWAARADGVHLGQEDLQAADARRLLGPAAIIGLSVKSLKEAETAPIEVLDYIFVGGVFATSSKDNRDPPIGVDGLADILALLKRRAPRMPVGAIAGIDAANAADVIGAGAEGVAVISALLGADDVYAATRTLRQIVDAARGTDQTA